MSAPVSISGGTTPIALLVDNSGITTSVVSELEPGPEPPQQLFARHQPADHVQLRVLDRIDESPQPTFPVAVSEIAEVVEPGSTAGAVEQLVGGDGDDCRS